MSEGVNVRVVGVSKSDTSPLAGRQNTMAQPHKGPRRLAQTRIPEPAYAEVFRLATDAGLSVSQYIADLMCLHVGMPEEARDITTVPHLISRSEVQLADTA